MTTHATVPTRRRFTVQEYYQMVAAGILREDDRTELIDGEVIVMPPIGGPHAGHVNRLGRRLWQTFDDVALVTVQNPVHLDEYDEPQPDFALVRRRDDDYTGGHPTPADIFVIIEVSDSTVAYDRRTKGLLYAQAGIPEYVMLDLRQPALVVFRDPSAEGYGSMVTLRRGQTWSPLAFPDRGIPVNDILTADA